MRTIPAAGICLSLAWAAGGCSTALKEGAAVALGAKGTYLAIRPLAAEKDARPLGAYRRFELGPFTDEVGGRVPGEFHAHLPRAFADQLRRRKLPDEPGGKALLLRGRIIHWEQSDMLGIAVGPLEEVIARVEMVDRDSGQVLAEANCVGRTTARVSVGVKSKAEGLAKALVGWIDNRYPTDRRVE